MVQERSDNVTKRHNGTVTARPRIFFPATSGKWEWVGGVRATEFTGAHVTHGTPEYREMEKATTEIGRTWLRALRLLRYVYSDDNETATRKALAQVGKLLAEEPGFQSMFATARKPKSVASVLYSINFTGEMKEARLVIHRTESGGFIPVLRCPNMKTAMFVFAAFGGAETCLNCQKLFAVDAVRPDGSSSDRYCTAGCGQRYRQKLYRLRKKARAKRPSRRKGQKP